MENLTELFDSLAKRPQMYVSRVSFDTIRAFLGGLAVGLRCAGFEWMLDDHHAAATTRGWDARGNIGIEREFIGQGLSDAEMVREFIAVEADAYRRAIARIGKDA